MKNCFVLTAVLFMMVTELSFSQNKLENNYDVKQYILDLNISNNSTEISGNVTIKAVVTAASLDTMVVELIGHYSNYTYMVCDSVFVDGMPCTFQHTGDYIFIPLTTAIPQSQLISVQIYYHGQGDPHVGTDYQGIAKATYLGYTEVYNSNEFNASKVWFPSKQVLTDKADSVIFYITTDSTNLTGSNGLLESKTILPNGKCRYKWVTHYPIAYYLISFVVGPVGEKDYYAKISSGKDSVFMKNLLIPTGYYYPIHLRALEKSDLLMNLYCDKFGLYPFKNEKFGYCIVGDQYGGMEHQTMCTMGYLLMDTTFTPLGETYCWGTAHEFAHHWFGDYVTCASWNHIWLHEGMATYAEYIAIQNLESQERANIWIKPHMDYIKKYNTGSVYVPDSMIWNQSRVFNGMLSYSKGAMVEHILRYEINNDSVFFLAIRNYLNAHAYSNATTEDLKSSFESTTRLAFTDFFNQWIYGQGYPIFNVRWSQSGDTLLIVSDESSTSTATPLFKTHFDLKVDYPSGDTIIRLFQGANHEVFSLHIPKKVSSLEFDPNTWLIQKNTIKTGIADYHALSNFDIYPNPAKNVISIDLIRSSTGNNASVSIYDIRGELLLQQSIKNQRTDVDISFLPSGIYFIRLIWEGNTEVKRFIKQ